MKKVLKPASSATWMEINLTQLEQNYMSVARHVGDGVGIISILKSNAYGHGIKYVAKCLSSLGTEKIGLASVGEVSELRRLGIKTPLLLLYPSRQSDFAELIQNNAEITIDNLDDALYLNRLAARFKKNIKVHIQIDTGLNRYGVNPTKAMCLVKEISELRNLSIEGLWTHYTNSESNARLSQKQFFTFMNIVRSISEIGIQVPFIHTANSGAICNLPISYNKETVEQYMPNAKILVRPGCLLYGTYSDKKNSLNTKPILDSLQTCVMAISTVEKGESVGYFQKFTAPKRMSVGTLPVGWGNTGYNPSPVIVSLHNKYSKGVGLISSNNMAIDVTNIPDVQINSNIFLLKDGDKKINVDRIAKLHGMFVNQFISMIGSKVEQVYFKIKQN